MKNCLWGVLFLVKLLGSMAERPLQHFMVLPSLLKKPLDFKPFSFRKVLWKAGHGVVNIVTSVVNDFRVNPACIYFPQVNNRNARKRCNICLKSTTKTPERRLWRCSGVFIFNFEHISHLILVFLLLTL